MTEASPPTTIPPFPPGYRAAGVLLHVTSLPSPYGVGDLGPSALQWIDALQRAGQSWWQCLPLGPTGYGNSPYQPMSSFAGNELLISPEWLFEDGLLAPADCTRPGLSESTVDYPTVIPFKHNVFEKAWQNFRSAPRADFRVAFERFCHDQAHWLDDFALFRALKTQHNSVHYLQWPIDLVQRAPAALAEARRELARQIQEVCFAQFLLFRQGARLREYGRARGVRLIGDLPFFVSPDSSDIWANPELFLLDEKLRPRFVAGVPPDYFSSQGQLWGNPVYNWENLRRTGYRWCIDRIRALLAHLDVIRLDHFRGFAAAWHVPAGASSAQAGHWSSGPGEELFNAVKRELGGLPFLVEDLGLISPDVCALRDQFGLPGTRVLQFAFDGHSDNPHLPHNYPPRTVVYTGTHDNPPTREWYEELPAYQRENVWTYLKSPATESRDVTARLINLAWSSTAALAIAPLQDVLNLGPEGRMNVPGRAEGNWTWRCTAEQMSGPAFDALRDLTERSNRLVAIQPLGTNSSA